MSNQPLRPSIRRIVQEEVQRIVGKDFDILKEVFKVLDSQNRIIISNLHNMRVALEKCAEIDLKMVAAIRECLSDPASQSEVDKVIQDFLNTKKKYHQQ